MIRRRWPIAAALVVVGPLVAWSVLGVDPAEKRAAAPAAKEGQVSPPKEEPGGTVSPKAAEQVDWKAMSEEEWRKRLTPEQYRVLREKGTERAFTGQYWNTKKQGTYKCAGCGLELFQSEAKFDSHCGWPSFFAPVGQESVDTAPDFTHNMRRIEVLCPRCGGHLGHVFDDGPQPTGLRYCINSASIKLDEKAAQTKKPIEKAP